jgi:hypothetical protein
VLSASQAIVPAAGLAATVPVGSVSVGVFVYSFGFTWNTNKPEVILMFP